MEGPQIMYADPALIDTIVGELKSQGTFDQFRKECIADVDTKPAYQNLHQRVESTVANFLEGKVWRPDLNKNQLRDSLRKHIHEMGFLETGVERIVDQVVNPKVNAVFMPQVEEVVYRVQGIPKPDKKPTATSSSAVGSTSKNGGVFSSGLFNQPPPFLPGLSFLPAALQNHMQKAPTLADLLPTDLDPVSPESSKDSEDETDTKGRARNSTIVEESDIIQHHDDSMESQLSGISDLTSHGSEHGHSIKSERRNLGICEEVNDDDSQLSKVSSNSKLSCESATKDQPEEKPEISSAVDLDAHKTNGTLETSYENAQEKSAFPGEPGGSVVEYGDQFTMEEEVATTVQNDHEVVAHDNIIKEESQAVVLSEDVKNVDDNMSLDNCSDVDKNLESLHSTFEHSDVKFHDENSTPQSEDSQFSGSSDNKLHIDEMKEFNSQSENSHQNQDEQSCLKTSSEGFLSEESNKCKSTVENVVEASEEARHGFDDSQDALERPPVSMPPLPPMPPADSSSEERPPPPPLTPPEKICAPGRSVSPSSYCNDIKPVHSSPMLADSFCERPPLPPTSPLVERANMEVPPIPSMPLQIERNEGSHLPLSPRTSLILETAVSQEIPETANECPHLLPTSSGRLTHVPPLPPSTPPLPSTTPPLPPATAPPPPATRPLPPATPPLPSTTPPLPSASPSLPSVTPPLPSTTPPLPPATAPPLPVAAPPPPATAPPPPATAPPLPAAAPPPPATGPLPPRTAPLPPTTAPLPPVTPPLPPVTPPLPPATPPLPPATPPLPRATPPSPPATPPSPSTTPPLPPTNPPLLPTIPPLPPTIPPLPSTIPPLPPTIPPLPPTIPPLPSETPPLPSATPPLPPATTQFPVKLDTSQCSPLEVSAEEIRKKSPEEEVSGDSYISPSYDESAIPKTPRWEPRSPKEEERDTFSSFEFLGNTSKIPQSFIPSLKKSDQDEESQSGSEEMQLAWSPLSAHGEDGNEDSGGRKSRELPEQHDAKFSDKRSSSHTTAQEVPVPEKSNLIAGHCEKQTQEKDKVEKCDAVDRDKNKERDRTKDEKTKERYKEDDRTIRDSSSKKNDEKSKHSRERKDSYRSRHDEKNRSEKDRDRHSSSSHHRADDKKRDEKEKSSSSRYKSSRSDDRHRHRDKERKNSSSGSSNVRHEDKSRDRSSKSEDKSKSSSKSHSNDRDRREKDRDKDRDRDSRDKDRKSDRDKERSKKESVRQDEKKREKEREKIRKDKNSSVCRPSNERRSPDLDSNNGSTFGGNNQTSSSTVNKSNQDSSTQESSKGTGSSDSNSKSSESSQQNGAYSEPSLLLSPNTHGPSSSLPFKKRPLLQDNEAKSEFSGKLILKIRKLNSSKIIVDARAKRMRAVRKLEKRSVRNLTYLSKFSFRVDHQAELPLMDHGPPTMYFETDWPSKSDDDAFLAYVQNLEQSKALCALSDYSGSDSEEEEILNLDDTKSNCGLESNNIMLSLSVLSDNQAAQLAEQSSPVTKHKMKNYLPDLKSSSTSSKHKNRTKRRKSLEDNFEGKRCRFNSKEANDPAPTEQKSRRARKPNKRYSNDEFTSTFDYEEESEELEAIVEDKNLEDVDTPIAMESELCKSEAQVLSTSTSQYETRELFVSGSIDQQEKENKINTPIENKSSAVSQPSKSISCHNKEPSYSWNRDSYNSNSEDEIDNTNNENDLIGTALKNLMMESGLGGPDEASGSEKLSSNSHSNLPNTLSGKQGKSIPLSGVKRVGLSKNYKGNKKFSVKPAVAALSSSEFSLPLSPDSDVSASTYDKGPTKKLKASSSSEASDKDVSAEASKLDSSRIKQHYSSDDLYKPRPPLRLTSKRRQVLSDHDEVF
ncbi:daf-12-interacting protein 1 isoform X1 [Frankliniella occidentalis]|uniref:Daf-12-interacting protein 1 isoform X1 n=1 Tax=Frankliniella occidentalis TaxID=133901 RepID=A0A6J1SNC9_FRAOC|nr:daf-12-interacting protein 1 isoform X1 [Frankliniella occidentalis]